MGQKVLRRQILKSPTAEATLNNIVPNGFFRADNKAALGELLLRRGARGGLSSFRHGFFDDHLFADRFFHIHCGQLIIGLNKPGLENGKLFDDKRSRLFGISFHNQLQQFGVTYHAFTSE